MKEVEPLRKKTENITLEKMTHSKHTSQTRNTKLLHRLTCFMSEASNQRRIPGSLYTVVNVVRSIHIDLNKKI